ncbi:hypothetical protein K474DRAFT_1741576 [Panus rudis PR-1116 ss-1]|nr:hypothetical protein K474DRAFT_1741576 [Panus rudis PR-1116 ss-1]
MKTAPADTSDKKGHVCPPSNATHPKDRWESLFVYGFICKFTQLRTKVEGLNSPMDFEDALLSPEANPIMTQILARFVLNLRPLTRNLGADQISSTLSATLQEYFKSSERMLFWDDELKMNVDPLQGLDGGFWNADWDLKLRILRQLVELQLCHSAEIKAIIDRAWGVIHNKHKKHETTPAPPPPSDPQSMESLQLVPLGQDSQRKRYWVIDDSPRVYLSTNPWKITATFHTVSSTREEYMAIIEELKKTAPSGSNQRLSKVEQSHLALIKALEDRIPAIDAELARIQRIRKKIEQRQLLMAQADLRETRTRRRTTRPDYAYLNGVDSEEEHDEYVYQEDQDYEMNVDDEDFQADDLAGGRRSTRKRSTRSKYSGNADVDEWGGWRGERRSARLGRNAEPQWDAPLAKRTRRETSVQSTTSGDTQGAGPSSSGLKIKIGGAAAVKPTETIVEAVAGKKKSKFWVYAVEPVEAPNTTVQPTPITSEPTANGTNGHRYMGTEPTTGSSNGPPSTNEDGYERSMEGSLSPSRSMGGS